MNRLLFSHKSDIDGMGEVILSIIAFKDIDYILCNNVSDLEEKFNEEYNSGNLYEYDQIYITDLSLRKNVAQKVFNDDKIKDKLYIFDHHETALADGLNNYPNCVVKIENEKGTMCATQIYYEYLIEKGYISRCKILDEFVEMVRREDVWEWKKYNDQKSHDLAILFNVIGYAKFIQTMVDKLVNNPNSNFFFTKDEASIIEDKKKITSVKVKNYLSFLKYINVDNIKVGVCFIVYEYRNEVGDFLKENKEKYDIDVVAMIALDNNQISLRGVRGNGNARKVAEKFGGGGHDNAAAIPITSDMKEKIVNQLFNF